MRGHEGGGPGGECGAEKNCELGGGGGLLPSSQIQEVFHQPQSHYIATVSVGRYYFVNMNLCLVRKCKTWVSDFLPTVGACSNIRYLSWYCVLLLILT